MCARIQVAQFGLGPIGISCLKLLVAKPWVEVVGAVDIRPELVGMDLGDVMGLTSLKGRHVFASFDDLMSATDVDAVLHTAGSKASQSLEQITPMLERGLAVVSSCEELLYPALRAPEATQAADALCQSTGGRVLGTGVNPGFVLDVLPVCLTGVCASVRAVYGERVVDAATRRQPLQKKIGSGMLPADFEQLGLEGKAGHAGFQESLMLIAHALGWRMGPIHETLRAVVAETLIQTEHFTVQPGETAGLHQIVEAEGDLGNRIHLDLKMYLGATNPHDTIRFDADPPIEATISRGVAGDLATVAALVNAIPRLLLAPAGVRLMTDLSLPACPADFSYNK